MRGASGPRRPRSPNVVLAPCAQRVMFMGGRLCLSARGCQSAASAFDSACSIAAETIIWVALENDSQAIVLGIEGRGKLGEVLLGSTSRDVIPTRRARPWSRARRRTRRRRRAGATRARANVVL